MKRMILIILSLIPLFAEAQEPQIVGGYLLDGKDSFEELEAAVLTESKSKAKKLDGKGMKLAGAVMKMTPESKGKEIGSIVKTEHPFHIRTISFTVNKNSISGCKACVRIYRVNDENDLQNTLTLPIYQKIPETDEKTTFNIAPEEDIVLDPGEYYISFSLTEADDNENGVIHFPLFVKGSYCRETADSPLNRMDFNIGIAIMGYRSESVL